mgnify:CR=1 FL=1|jgi:hypothetical protein
MLTPEKINYFNQLLQTGNVPGPEDSADWEIYKAYQNSQALAQQAAAPVAAPTTVPANIPTNNVSNQAMAAPANGTSYTMDDLMSNQMVVDNYLKVKYQQTFIGNDVVGDKEIYVAINLSNVVAKLSIKGGQPVSYASTVDGKVCLSGGSWLEAVADIQKKDPKARPYNCVDLPMTVIKEVKGFSGNTVAAVGTVIGHTTSTTNWKPWVDFYRNLPQEVRERGEEVYVKLTRRDVSKNSNNWALVDFEYVPLEQAHNLGLVSEPF